MAYVGRNPQTSAKGFGAEVGYTDSYVDESEYQRFGDIEELATWTDVLTIHLPHDDDTHHIVGESVLKMLGSNGIIINTARGGLVDERALYWATKASSAGSTRRSPQSGVPQRAANSSLGTVRSRLDC